MLRHKTPCVVTISVAAGAAPAYYDVAVKAANSSAPTAVGTAMGTVAIAGTGTGAGTATGSLAVSVKANASYPRPKGGKPTNATLQTTVKSGATALKGATVSVQVRYPLGGVQTLSATTGNNGVANVNYAIAATSAVGTYAVTSTATMGSDGASGTTSFAVK